jgi:hypothetical protein
VETQLLIYEGLILPSAEVCLLRRDRANLPPEQSYSDHEESCVYRLCHSRSNLLYAGEFLNVSTPCTREIWTRLFFATRVERGQNKVRTRRQTMKEWVAVVNSFEQRTDILPRKECPTEEDY